MNTNNCMDREGFVGSILKEQRIKLGISIDQVVSDTKLRENHIYALEECKLDQLAGRAYILGYIEKYARFLGLPSKDLVNQASKYLDLAGVESDCSGENNDLKLKVKSSTSARLSNKSSLISRSDSNKNIKPNKKYFYFALLAVFILIIVILAYIEIQNKKKHKVVRDNLLVVTNGDGQLNKPTDHKGIIPNKALGKNLLGGDTIELDSSKAASVNSIPGSLDENQSKSSEGVTTERQPYVIQDNEINLTPWPNSNTPSILSIYFTARSWIKIYDSNNTNIVYVEKIYNPGESLTIPNIPDLVMKTGNYKGLYIVLNNQKLVLQKSKPGLIMKEIKLEGKFLQTIAKPIE